MISVLLALFLENKNMNDYKNEKNSHLFGAIQFFFIFILSYFNVCQVRSNPARSKVSRSIAQ
jgi:Mn2+/Fe2+ NRAMP family transporter